MKKILVLAGLLALGGCAPGESDMQGALLRNAQFRVMLAMAGGGMRPEDVAIEKSSCTDAQGTPGYVCDFRIGRRLPGGSVNYGGSAKGRFFKSGGGWEVELVR
jgi:hypothetical protein